MSETSPTESQGAANADTATINPRPKTQGGPPKDLPPPPPTLAAYYAKPPPRLKDWIAAIKTAKVTDFVDDDVEKTSASLADLDFDLRKTLLLANEPNPPRARPQ